MRLFRFLRRKQDNSLEARRRLLLEHGRVADGVIIEVERLEDGTELAHYSYSIHGVDFESAEILTSEQCLDPIKYAPGAYAAVRYDPRNHHNSVLV